MGTTDAFPRVLALAASSTTQCRPSYIEEVKLESARLQYACACTRHANHHAFLQTLVFYGAS
jgi:hypothetical protein